MSHQGELAALATAFCWTLTALSFESAGKRVGSLAVNLVRLVMAFVILSIVGWIARGHVLPTDASPSAWLWLALSGLVGFALGDLCLFRAFVLVGARIAMLIMALVPPMTALLGWFFLGEQLGLRHWVGMAITVSGVTWVALERRAGDVAASQSRVAPGVLLALGAAVGQAVGLILSKFGMGGYSPFASAQIRVLAGAIAFTAIFSLAHRWRWVATALHDLGAMVRISVGAFFGPFLGVSLSLLAVQHTATGVAATIMSIVPVLIIAPAVLAFHEKVSLRAVVGALVAVAGVALLFL